MLELVELCIDLSDVKNHNYFNVQFLIHGDSILVDKIVNNEHVDIKVASLCEFGAEYLIGWINENKIV